MVRDTAACALLTAALLPVLGSPLEAQTATPKPRRATARPAATGTTTRRLSGTVVTRHEPPRPVPGAHVQLRDRAGAVVAAARANSQGAFVFALPGAGPYCVEVVEDEGRVLAVECEDERAAIAPVGDATPLTLRVPVPVAGGWPTSAKLILGAAAASGVAAIVSSGTPASPER